MSDDSFIREVDEELRSDRMQNIWKRYGKLIIAIAIAIVVVTAGYRFWLSYSKGEAAKSGDVFLEAVELSNDGKHDDAIAMISLPYRFQIFCRSLRSSSSTSRIELSSDILNYSSRRSWDLLAALLAESLARLQSPEHR